MTVPFEQALPRLHPARLDGEKDWQLTSVFPSLFLVPCRRGGTAARNEESSRERPVLAINRRFHRRKVGGGGLDR